MHEGVCHALENLLVALLSGSTRLLLQCGLGVTEEYCICWNAMDGRHYSNAVSAI